MLVHAQLQTFGVYSWFENSDVPSILPCLWLQVLQLKHWRERVGQGPVKLTQLQASEISDRGLFTSSKTMRPVMRLLINSLLEYYLLLC